MNAGDDNYPVVKVLLEAGALVNLQARCVSDAFIFLYALRALVVASEPHPQRVQSAVEPWSPRVPTDIEAAFDLIQNPARPGCGRCDSRL